MEIVTGYKGKPHVTAKMEGAKNAGIFGSDNYVLAVGNRFEATAISSTEVQIADGSGMMHGRNFVIEAGKTDTVTLENGYVGMKRNDLIVARYTKNADTGVEDISLAVVKGTPTEGTPTDPIYANSDLLGIDQILSDFPLYRVKFDGINITLEQMFSVSGTLEQLEDLEEKATKVVFITRIQEQKNISISAYGSNYVEFTKPDEKGYKAYPISIWTNAMGLIPNSWGDTSCYVYNGTSKALTLTTLTIDWLMFKEN